jgi:hypothetical protein
MTEPAVRTTPGPAPAPSWRRRWAWILGLAVLAGAAVAPAWELVQVLFLDNWHTVVPGRVYRCAQQSGTCLEELAARHGIRTVINLRGCCYPEPWYLEESRATHRAGVCQEDVAFSAGRLPSRTEMRRLLEVLDHTTYPVVLHCRRGADRTGMACAIILFLQPDIPFAQARRQLGLRYGHVALGRAAYLDEFCNLYEGWLRDRGQKHTPEVFRDWLLHHYRAGHCSCVFERAPAALGPVPPGRPQPVPVRLRNDSAASWHFSPADKAGVHLAFLLSDAAGKRVASGRAGLLEADVAPGQSIDLTVVLPGIARPGVYRLFMDMQDEAQAWFYQMGSEPFECEVRIGETEAEAGG